MPSEWFSPCERMGWPDLKEHFLPFLPVLSHPRSSTGSHQAASRWALRAVAVMDRNFNVIYANESALAEDAAQLSGHKATCYEAFAHRDDPCGTSPATRCMNRQTYGPWAYSTGGDGTACGMRYACPFVSSS